MINDSITNHIINTTQKNIFFNNNTQFVLKGKVYDGDLAVDFSTYNYKQELFSFGGLGFKYKNKYKDYYYEAGRVKGFSNEGYSIGTTLFGFQAENFLQKEEGYRKIEGYVEKDSLIKLYVNDKEYSTLSTYDGYYSLHNVFLNEKPKSLKIAELKADKSTKILYEKTYPKYTDMPAKGEKRLGGIIGMNGYSNRLFSQNGFIYEMNTKKVVLGANYQYGINDNLKFDTKLLSDKIIYQPKNSIWESISKNDSLLNSGAWKNPNNIEGLTSLNTIEWIKNDNFSHKFILGLSSSKDKTKNDEILPGYSASYKAEMKKDFYNLNASLFNTSSDFYLAGSEGGFINDRTGAGIGGGIQKKEISLNANYKKYISNTAKHFEGGLIYFDEYNLGMSKNFEKLFDAKFNINSRTAENSLAKNRNYYYDLNFLRHIGNKITLQAGKNESNYQTTYNVDSSAYSDIKSLYSTIYVKTDYLLPKNKGKLALGHDIITYDNNSYTNKYNIIKMGYTFPEIKRLTLSFGTGYKYKGRESGFDTSINLAYRCKSGRTVSLNYQYTQNGGYIIDNLYIPTSMRHSVNLALNDAFAILPNRLKSVGFTDENKGYTEITTYIDKNKNGKFDKGDIGVKNVPVKCSWINDEVYTNCDGKVIPQSIDKGIYKVKLDVDKLPATLMADKIHPNETVVRIDGRKITKVEFPLKSCVGNITGKLTILDDFGRSFNINDFIVVLNDESDNEVAYSTVDCNGNFYFSGIEPGKYAVELDEGFVESSSLYSYEDKSSINIEIPYVYEDFVDINNVNLIYKTY